MGDRDAQRHALLELAEEHREARRCIAMLLHLVANVAAFASVAERHVVRVWIQAALTSGAVPHADVRLGVKRHVWARVKRLVDAELDEMVGEVRAERKERAA